MLEVIKKEVVKQLDNRKKPTPKFWETIGSLLDGAGKAIAGYVLVSSINPLVGVAALIVGVIGKEITKFTTEKIIDK